MNQARRYFFTLHELLIMASLAALGGVSSSLIGMVRTTVHSLLPFHGMQSLAGIHVLWLVLVVGLVRKPGAATITGLLAGAVELLSGNPHGLLSVAYAGLAGIVVDAVWIFFGGIDHPVVYMLAGGVGAASNVLVTKYAASLGDSPVLASVLLIMTGVAFLSGIVLAGALGWWLLQVLRRAGVVGAHPDNAPLRTQVRAWAGASVLFVGVVLFCAATFLPSRSAASPPADHDRAPAAAHEPVRPQ